MNRIFLSHFFTQPARPTANVQVVPSAPAAPIAILLLMLSAGLTTAPAQSMDGEFPADQGPLTIIRDTSPNAPGQYKMSLPGVGGRVYLMQKTSTPQNPASWTWMDTQKLGSNLPLEWWVTPVSGPPRLFYLVRMTLSTGYTVATAGDIDGDGLSNAVEMAIGGLGADPFSADTDADGMPDGWEVTNLLNPKNPADASLDSDQDTLSNLREYQLGTKPGVKDSDEDGLNDNVEFTAGGNPTRFDMPKFTVLSSWRKVRVTNSRNIPASGTTAISAQAMATSAGTLAGAPGKTWTAANPVFPWTMPAVAPSVWNAGVGDPSGRPAIPIADPVTPHDMSKPLFSSLQESMDGGADFMAVSGQPNSQESRFIQRNAVLVERVIRIQALRAMPKNWFIPYTLRKVTQNTATYDWSQPTAITTGTGGQPLRFTFNQNDPLSSAVTLDISSMGNPSIDLPGQSKDLNGNWVQKLHTSSRALAWITFEKLPSLPQGDPDQDGLSSQFEGLLGTDPNQANSDGRGYNDGDELNAGALPPAAGYFLSTRRVNYAYYRSMGVPDFPSVHQLKVETSLPSKNVSQSRPLNTQPYGLGDPMQTAINGATPFPTGLPAGPVIPSVDESGEADSDGTPTALMTYSEMGVWNNPGASVSARGTQKGNIHAVLDKAPVADRTEMYYLLRTVWADANGGPGPATLKSQPVQFKAGKRESDTAINLLAQRINGEVKIQEDLGKVSITPDVGMAGVLGDMIVSANPNSAVLHFVTPKQSAAPPADPTAPPPEPNAPPNPDLPLYEKDAVKFTATGISAENFAKYFDWDTGGNPRATVTGNTCKVSRSVAAGDPIPSPVILKIKTKAAPVTFHSEVHVWVVWATCTASHGEATFQYSSFGSGTGAFFKDTNLAWRFKFKIMPAAICNLSTPERPDLAGEKKTKVPGSGKKTPFNWELDADTAQFKWDVSRQIKWTIRNPQSISKDDLANGEKASPWAADQPKAVNSPMRFPNISAEGNDDATLTDVMDEDNDPYHAKSDVLLAHSLGELSSFDRIGLIVLNSWGEAGRTLSKEFNFREFARLELWNGWRKEGSYWFRISDYYLCHHYLSASYDKPAGKWRNSGSSSFAGHPNP